MNQLRLDPLTGRWVVVSIDRAAPPVRLRPRTAPVQADTTRPVPFCPGNEESTPPALETYGSSGPWLVRVVPNLYPAFEGDHPFVVEHRGPVFTQATAGGIHEVLVLSPEHDHGWDRISDEQAGLVMAAIRDRIEEHSNVPGLRYSQAIVNAGREAGASIEHPHGQLLGMSFVPRELAEEQAGFARFAGRCLLCTTVDAEEDAGYRVVYADERVLVVCPFWSGTPYEMLVIPRTHGPHLHRATPADLVGGGPVAAHRPGSAARAAAATWPTTSSSTPPPTGRPSPTTGTSTSGPSSPPQAGFELGTGVLINIVAPEQATEELRVAVPACSPDASHADGRLSRGTPRPRRGRGPGRPSSTSATASAMGTRTISPACSATIVPKAPSWTAATAATPKRVASTRSKAVGVPPRWMWPRVVTRASKPVRRSISSASQVADPAQPGVAELVDRASSTWPRRADSASGPSAGTAPSEMTTIDEN